MKRSEIYLKAAELVTPNPNNYATTFCAAIVAAKIPKGKFKFDLFPELDHDETSFYDQVDGYCSELDNRDFILLFASELAKDTNN